MFLLANNLRKGATSLGLYSRAAVCEAGSFGLDLTARCWSNWATMPAARQQRCTTLFCGAGRNGSGIGHTVDIMRCAVSRSSHHPAQRDATDDEETKVPIRNSDKPRRNLTWWSDAIAVADRSGDLAPLIALLRSEIPLGAMPRELVADLLSRHELKRKSGGQRRPA